jgi:hypothetical protein
LPFRFGIKTAGEDKQAWQEERPLLYEREIDSVGSILLLSPNRKTKKKRG